MSSKVDLKNCEIIASIKFICPKCVHENYLIESMSKSFKKDAQCPIIRSCRNCYEEIHIGKL